jgi:hypothetical protein
VVGGSGVVVGGPGVAVGGAGVIVGRGLGRAVGRVVLVGVIVGVAVSVGVGVLVGDAVGVCVAVGVADGVVVAITSARLGAPVAVAAPEPPANEMPRSTRKAISITPASAIPPNAQRRRVLAWRSGLGMVGAPASGSVVAEAIGSGRAVASLSSAGSFKVGTTRLS